MEERESRLGGFIGEEAPFKQVPTISNRYGRNRGHQKFSLTRAVVPPWLYLCFKMAVNASPLDLMGGTTGQE
jgi:hypothetical protein